jgi:hypothetical protein
MLFGIKPAESVLPWETRHMSFESAGGPLSTLVEVEMARLRSAEWTLARAIENVSKKGKRGISELWVAASAEHLRKRWDRLERMLTTMANSGFRKEARKLLRRDRKQRMLQSSAA